MSFLIMGSIIIYPFILFIALWLIPKVVHHKHIKRIIFVVWFLIPTWDVIIGYPIYKFLCVTQAGVHIYKTVDNVEGFYVGEDIGTYSKIPPMPYKGYKYIEYKKRENQKQPFKYYRVSWVDVNTTDQCVQLGRFYKESYVDVLSQGKCIVKEEVAENDISRWNSEIKQVKKYHQTSIYVLGISIDKVGQIQDKKINEILSEQFLVNWNVGWFYGWFLHLAGPSSGTSCGTDDSNVLELYHKTLKPKQGN